MSQSYTGFLHKMNTELTQPVDYFLQLGDDHIKLNDWIGKTISIQYHHHIECVHCGRKTNKSFNQGFCYPCFKALPQCDICIVSPEKCHHHEGTCRDNEWADEFCFAPHIIYFSNTSGIKVGITRQTQVPTRWIDQGARQALPVLRVANRFHSGIIETAFKPYMNDKTNWRTMLKDEYNEHDLSALFLELWPAVKKTIDSDILSTTEELIQQPNVYDIEFPALDFPTKITSFNLDKTDLVSGTLRAIKGQYLILDTGVINIRKFSGYKVTIQ